MKNYYLIFIQLIITLLSTSCHKQQTVEPAARTTSHLIFVYMAGDNNLSRESHDKIEALRSGWNSEGNIIVVYHDCRDEAPSLMCINGTGSGEAVTLTEKSYPEHNSASGEALSAAISDVLKNHRADSYGMIVFSHASGWLPSGTLSNPCPSVTRSLAQDSNFKEELELADFAGAIPDGVFDYIIFESCLMSGVEVAYELRNKCGYILASAAEIVSPGFTNIYPRAAVNLAGANSPVAEKLISFGEEFFTEVNSSGNYYNSATLSLISTARMQDLASCVRSLNTADTVDLWNIQYFDRPGAYGDSPARPRFFDFLDYYEKASTSRGFDSLADIVNDVVVWERSTEQFLERNMGYKISTHSGLTTYVPQDGFEYLNREWEQTAWARAIK